MLLLCLVLILKGIFLIGSTDTDNDTYDKNLVRALATFYGDATPTDTFDFENYLVEYFKDNYKELMQNSNNNFLFKFANNNADSAEEGDLFKIAREFGVDPSNFENHFGSNLVIKDELIYENSNNGLNVIYGSDKAINNIIEDLASTSLYYKNLAKKNLLASNNSANLQNAFVAYAKNKGTEVPNNLTTTENSLVQRKRFVKRKNKKNNVIDFKQDLG